MGTTVGQNITGNLMESEHEIRQDHTFLYGLTEAGEDPKSVYDGDYGGVTFKHWETSNKIQI